jgi:hypothetical protein
LRIGNGEPADQGTNKENPMKIADGLKIIENGWIRKPKGFRVSFQRHAESGLENGLSPPPGTAPLNSDVTAWRYAWKLAQSTSLRTGAPRAGDMINIFVVDQDNNPILYYATGEKEIFNEYEVVS